MSSLLASATTVFYFFSIECTGSLVVFVPSGSPQGETARLSLFCGMGLTLSLRASERLPANTRAMSIKSFIIQRNECCSNLLGGISSSHVLQ